MNLPSATAMLRTELLLPYHVGFLVWMLVFDANDLGNNLTSTASGNCKTKQYYLDNVGVVKRADPMMSSPTLLEFAREEVPDEAAW
jgi:hypothetical protein